MYFFGKSFKKTKGFTLIELMVVIAVIGVLASVIVASLNSARKKGRDATRMRDMQEIRKAIELYISDNGHPPDLGTPDCLDINYSSTTGECVANETAYYLDNWEALETQLSPYISSLSEDPCGIDCYDSYNPNLNYAGFFVYTYEAPSAIGTLPGANSMSYFINAQNFESRNNTSFGFGLGSSQ